MKEHPTLRYHKICVAFFGDNGEVVEEKEVIVNNTEETTLEYNATLKPQAVLLNYKDWSYIKINLDPVSKAYFLKHFTSLDVLSKALIVRSLYDNARDAVLPLDVASADFLDLLEREEDSEMIKFITTYFSGIVSSYLSPEQKALYRQKLFDLSVQKLLATDDFDTVSEVRKSLIGNARTPESIQVLADYLDGKHALKKHKLSLSEKWQIVFKILASDDATFSQMQKYQYYGRMMIED